MSRYTRRFSTIPRPETRLETAMQGIAARRRHALGALGDQDTPLDETAPPSTSGAAGLPPWIYPPVNWENIDLLSYALLPAIAATVTILDFTVPAGRNGVIRRVACNFVGGGWVEGSGDVVWRILVDGATPPGATSYDSIVASLGSPANPVEISGFRIFENQRLTLVGFNNAVVVAGQRLGARLIGHMYPRELEDDNTWI